MSAGKKKNPNKIRRWPRAGPRRVGKASGLARQKARSPRAVEVYEGEYAVRLFTSHSPLEKASAGRNFEGEKLVKGKGGGLHRQCQFQKSSPLHVD